MKNSAQTFLANMVKKRYSKKLLKIPVYLYHSKEIIMNFYLIGARMSKLISIAGFCHITLSGCHILLPSLPAEITTAVTSLKQAWKTDPRTRDKPFPSITPISQGIQGQQECQNNPFATQDALATYCAKEGRVLIDSQRIESLAAHNGEWDAAVWIAVSLSQAISYESGLRIEEKIEKAFNLQIFCFAGVLLGQASGLKTPTDGRILSAAFLAYPSHLDGSQGTGAQRSYALLTGLGGTASDCEDPSMFKLAKGEPPDRNRFQGLAFNPDRSTGNGAIDEVMKALCLPKPPQGCPRRLPKSRVRSTSL